MTIESGSSGLVPAIHVSSGERKARMASQGWPRRPTPRRVIAKGRWYKTDRITGRQQTGNALDRDGVGRMIGLRPPWQDFGDNENTHPRVS